MKYLIILSFMCGLTAKTIAQTAPANQPPADIKSKVIEIKKGQTYLNIPVNPSSSSVRMRIKFDGKPVEMSNVRLSDNPTFWTFYDVSGYQGKAITFEIENAQQGGRGGANAAVNASPPALNEKALNMVFADTKYPGQEGVYKEADRPQVHFSSQRGHINDPNGLVYYNNEYHMFYQHNPYGIDGGNQHWGHAVSKDMIHWVQQREAIYPFLGTGVESGRGDLAFSGSATYDPKNTSGFRKNGIDPLIAFYTSTGRGECIKMSYDNGQTFEDYAGNPIIKHAVQGRDPKILWYAPGNYWVLVAWDAGQPKKMSLGQEASVRQNLIFTSPDMKNWTFQSGVPGFFECPDFYELPIQGTNQKKWVMSDANGRYMLGEFDGKHFKVDQQEKDYVFGGRYYYAAQTINNMPDSRRVQIGWGNYNYPGAPFTQTMLFPNELKLKTAFDGIRLCPTPIKEIASLHKSNQVVENKVVTADAPVTVSVDPEAAIHVIAEFEKGDAPLSLNIMGYSFTYDNEWQFTAIPPPAVAAASAAPANNGFGNTASIPAITPVRYVSSNTDLFKIEAILDKNMLEVYVNDGELYYVTEFKGTKTGKIEAAIQQAGNRGGGGGSNGAATVRKFIVKKLEVHELNSAWPQTALVNK